MVLHLSNFPLGNDIAMAKTLSITIVRTMSASTVEALCATDVVQRVPEAYLKEESTKWKKPRLQMESNTSIIFGTPTSPRSIAVPKKMRNSSINPKIVKDVPMIKFANSFVPR